MTKNLDAIKKQERDLREKLFAKTGELLDQILKYVPTRTVLLVNSMPVKVIAGADGRKSLLINNRPLSTADDCEWVIENYSVLTQAVNEHMDPEAEEIIKVIEKTEDLIKKVDNLTQDIP
ncbi:hypothetical protein [Dethiobacter alkaliphilus]|uniref:Uncharacterized protein n=1 Tax=Dethiobacter alkaliphilus AHT 1 TaxID=555088 RepID=C0GFN3_DETAL|nr:hypothetical protein [Dethiobacter alkaliphilus]EEG77993.1 hypothetical protein DealDRAFT_1292 [Dethiobacter alkaliphilus AHT 1]